MECVESKEAGLSDPGQTDVPMTEKAVGRFAEKKRWWRGLAISLVIHAALLLGLFAILEGLMHLRFDPEVRRLDMAVVEPLSEPEFIEPEAELSELLETDTPDEIPELVAQPEPPMEMPPDPLPPEPLDWNPPDNLIAQAQPWLPKPKSVQIEVEVDTPPPITPEPKPRPPVILEGSSIPTTTKAPQPSYPRQALRMGWYGTVCLRVTVDAGGFVTHGFVEETSGHHVLDEAALKAFKLWEFEPRSDGRNDVRSIRKRFAFKLPQ